MCSNAVVVIGVGIQNPAQMRLAQDDDVVQTFAPNRSDQPFGNPVLPRGGRCDRLVPNSHGAQSACDNGAEDPITIPKHVTRSPVPRKSLGYLTRNPLRCRVGCHIDPDEISAIKPDNRKAIQQSEANGFFISLNSDLHIYICASTDKEIVIS
jgi:hypothetical protein